MSLVIPSNSRSIQRWFAHFRITVHKFSHGHSPAHFPFKEFFACHKQLMTALRSIWRTVTSIVLIVNFTTLACASAPCSRYIQLQHERRVVSDIVSLSTIEITYHVPASHLQYVELAPFGNHSQWISHFGWRVIGKRRSSLVSLPKGHDTTKILATEKMALRFGFCE